jgi:type IV secretion system protein VirD4
MNSARNWWVTPFMAVLATVIITNLACHAVAVVLTKLVCGVSATPRDFFAGLFFLLTGSPDAYRTAPGCIFPAAAVRVVDITVVVLIVAAAIAGGVLWARYRQSDGYFIRQLRARPGFARGGEVAKHLSARAVLTRASRLRPALTSPRPTDMGWKVGRSAGMDVFVSIEDSVALEGAPRSGKGYRILISAILDWAGPLITTSTTTDNLAATMKRRATRGRVTVFDPQRLSGVASALRISPITGCEDPLTATQRGQAIIAGTALGASNSNQEWAGVAAKILTRLLHAAAVSGSPVEQLYRWGSNPGLAKAAVEILRHDGAPGWAEDLNAVITGDPKLLASSWFGVAGAVEPLSIPTIREALSPEPGAEFDPQEFLSGENTLYLIGSGAGAGSMGGFLGAMLDDIVETARRKALATAGARLDQPLGLILDEIANMFAWPALPRVMADGGGRGICTLVVLQALSQAETAWSKAEADTIWSAATAKVLLGGASDVSHLRDIEAILGTRRVRHQSQSYSQSGSSTSEQYERVPVMTVDEIRRMPETTGLLAYRNRRGVLLDLRGWTERADSKTISADKTRTEVEQQQQFATQLSATASVAATATAGEAGS